MRMVVHSARLAGALVLACLATPLAAQRVARPKEPRGFDFRPDGAWRKIARGVRQNRGAALARGDIQFLNAPSGSAAVIGDFKLPVVFVDFADTVASGFELDTAAFGRLFFSADPSADGRPYSLKSYYEQMSRNNITIDGNVFGWVHTAFTKAFVGQNCHGALPGCTSNPATHFGAWLVAALDSLNSVAHQVDWSQYDIDGDGFVDFVTFIHPTIGGECGPGNGATPADIWAHRYYLGALRGAPYVTKTPWPGHAGQFIRIDDYIIQSARGGSSGCNTGSMMPVGTVAHETGHAFGIPDLYCANGCAKPDEGAGEWSLMASGNYTIPRSPAAWDAWSLQTLGWIKVDTLTASRTVTLSPIQTSDTALIAPITGTDQYLLLENRAFLLSDTAQMGPDLPTSSVCCSIRKSPGLLIWHIDQSIVTGGLPGNTVNVGPVDGVRLIQADGLQDLQAGTDRGDLGDSYPGLSNNHALRYNTNPSATTNEGAAAGFVIDSIQQLSTTGPVVFRFRRSAPYRVTTNAIASGGQVTVNGVTTTAYEELFGLGDTVNISITDSQLVNGGRTRIAFQSWSDAGARVHQVISDGTPDTVTATVAIQHRVNFLANGNGTVGTSGPVNNTFVDAGTTVTLTATPNGGNTFTNWTGDTASNNAVIVLPMGRPYSVTANFTGAVSVTPDEATDAILQVTPLTPSQATYLDAVGNNNGSYDLGDYLAYLKAHGIVPAPGVLTRVMMRGAKPLVAPTRKEQ
jgi:M6 family metalloprotease-like protein